MAIMTIPAFGENDRLDIFGKVLGKSDASVITGHCR